MSAYHPSPDPAQIARRISVWRILASVFWILFILSIFLLPAALVNFNLFTILFNPLSALAYPLILVGLSVLVLAGAIGSMVHLSHLKKAIPAVPGKYLQLPLKDQDPGLPKLMTLPDQTDHPLPPKPLPQVYQKKIDALAKIRKEALQSKAPLYALVDRSFGDSFITQTRYKTVLDKAYQTLEDIEHNTKEAAGIFASGTPSEKRIALLEKYVHDAREISVRISCVCDELLNARQNNVSSSGQALEESLDELASSAVRYAIKD